MSIDTYFCLCCLSTENLSSLFDSNSENNCGVLLKELFAVSITQEDGDNDYICMECAEKLKTTQTFKNQVFKSVKILHDMGLINLTKINDSINVEKVLKFSTEGQNKDFENKQDSPLKEAITIQQVKENKLDNIKIKDGSDIIRHFLANDPIKALEQNSNKKIEEDLHGVTEDLRCKICDVVLPNLYGFHSHINMHFPNHICEICGKGFVTERRLKRHKYCHETGPFVCQECGKQFNNYSTYSSHRKFKHTNIQKYACPFCDERFNSLSVRARHTADAHHRAATHACALCDKQFLTSALLNSHIRHTHMKIKRHFCDQCDVGFYHAQELKGHMTTHTGVNPYKCHLCSKSYRRKKALTVHLKVHTNDKRFCCDICNKKFIQKCTLTSHMKTHNREKTKVTPKVDKAENGQPKVDFGQPEKDLGQPKVDLGQPVKAVDIPAEVITKPGHSKINILNSKALELNRTDESKMNNSEKPLLYNCYKIFY